MVPSLTNGLGGTGNAIPLLPRYISNTPSTKTVQCVTALVPSTYDLFPLILRFNHDFPLEHQNK